MTVQIIDTAQITTKIAHFQRLPTFEIKEKLKNCKDLALIIKLVGNKQKTNENNKSSITSCSMMKSINLLAIIKISKRMERLR